MAAVPASRMICVRSPLAWISRGAQGRTDGDPYRTDRVFGGAARGACDPCRGDSVVCICQMTDAFGHLAYDLFADGAVAGYRIAADVYEVLLRPVRLSKPVQHQIRSCSPSVLPGSCGMQLLHMQ